MTELPEVKTSPVVKVARDLTEILNLTGNLEDQAIAKATDPLMPGGLAMVALANVANLEAWESTLQGLEAYNAQPATKTRRDLSHIDDEDDAWEPVLQTLLFWSEQWRVTHDAEHDKRASVASEAAFIRWALDWAWDNEPRFDDFAKDVRRARVRLEELLYAGKRAERTRVPRMSPTSGPGDPNRAALPSDDDERFCPECFAGMESSEHHEKCVTPSDGSADD